MLISPGRFKIIGVIGIMAMIKIDNLLDAILVAVGLHQHRERRRTQSVRLKHQMIGHVARRLQILFHQLRRHDQRFARVVEARRISGVDRKFARRPQIEAREIANGVIVF